MSGYVKRGAGVLVALVVLSLLVGQLLGQPILIGYVATGSMEPTMNAGDGFVAVPSAIAGSPEEGDVVVFDAVELHDGELTTHRIAEETDEGYVTVGDANPFTDQDAAEPHVTDEQIVAHALQVNDEVVTIPQLGTVVMGVGSVVESVVGAAAGAAGIAAAFDGDNAGSLLVGLGVALLGFGVLLEVFGPTQRSVRRTRKRQNVLGIWTAIGLVLVVFVLFATAAMVVPSGTVAYGLVADESPSDDPQVVEPGATTELEHELDNAGYVPIAVLHDTGHEDVGVEPHHQTIGPRGEGTATVSMTAPEETGEYTRHVEDHRYLLVLPPSVLAWLHGVHPLFAIGAVNAVIVGASVTLVVAIFGSTDFRFRRPGENVGTVTRLRRKLRRWR